LEWTKKSVGALECKEGISWFYIMDSMDLKTTKERKHENLWWGKEMQDMKREPTTFLRDASTDFSHSFSTVLFIVFLSVEFLWGIKCLSSLTEFCFSGNFISCCKWLPRDVMHKDKWSHRTTESQVRRIAAEKTDFQTTSFEWRSRKFYLMRHSIRCCSFMLLWSSSSPFTLLTTLYGLSSLLLPFLYWISIDSVDLLTFFGLLLALRAMNTTRVPRQTGLYVRDCLTARITFVLIKFSWPWRYQTTRLHMIVSLIHEGFASNVLRKTNAGNMNWHFLFRGKRSNEGERGTRNLQKMRTLFLTCTSWIKVNSITISTNKLYISPLYGNNFHVWVHREFLSRKAIHPELTSHLLLFTPVSHQKETFFVSSHVLLFALIPDSRI
jgi:hypothetical protein